MSNGNLVRSFTGHNNALIEVAFSQSGDEILTAGEDDVAKLWDTNTGNLKRNFNESSPNLGSSIWAVDFSPNGQDILTGSENGNVKVWNKSTGQILLDFKAHNGASNWGWTFTAYYSPDGTKIVTGSHRSPENSAKVWDANNGSLLFSLDGHSDIIGDAAFTPDGTKIVTTSNDSTIKIWNASNGSLIKTIQGNGSSDSWNVRVAPNNIFIITSSKSGNAKLWNIETGQLLKEFPSNVYGVAFSKDGKLVATGQTDGIVKIWNINKFYPSQVPTATATPSPTPTPTNTQTPTRTPTNVSQNINTVSNFPDANFKAFIEEYMGVEPNGIFTAEQAASKTVSMNISNKSINSLKGIEYFTKIKSLTSQNNNLTEVNLSNLKELESIDF